MNDTPKAAGVRHLTGIFDLTTDEIHRLFELTEPKTKHDYPWFYYEYTDKFQHTKCSTEDVTASRDMSLAGCRQLGYNPVFVNWDAWAGHIKQKTVGKPQLVTPDHVSQKLHEAVEPGRLPSDTKRIVADIPRSTSGIFRSGLAAAVSIRWRT